MSTSDTTRRDDRVPALAPHEVNLTVARWSAEVAELRTLEDCDEAAGRLGLEPQAVQAKVQPLIVARRARLGLAAAPAVVEPEDDEAPNEAETLAWVPDAVALVRRAAVQAEAGEPGATGLVPLGFLRDGGRILRAHRVVIRDQFKGNRAAIFAQSGKGKSNLVKVVLYWTLFNGGYGKLIFDYKGEYVPWTRNERGEDVPGLCEHPLARERVVLYTTKERHLEDPSFNAKVTVRRLKVHLRSVLPRDFASFWPNLTKAQQEFLYTYDDDPGVYEVVLGEEKGWRRLSAWFGDAAKAGGEDDEGEGLEASGKRVVRNIRKKLQAAQKRSYIVDSPAWLEPGDRGWATLHAPYHQGFLNALKAEVPGGQRRWNAEAKVWTVGEGQRAVVEQLIGRFFGQVGELDSLSLISQDLAEGKLAVVDFSGIASESDRDLIATLVTRRQFEHNLERIDLEEGPEGRVPFVAFFEEAQNLLGADKVRDSRNSIFIRAFKEGRALSIGTTSITQQPGALSKDLTSQIAYYVVQHLRSRDDIRDLVSMDPAVEGAESDIARRVPGNALYVDNDRGFPLPIKIDRFDRAFVEAVERAYREERQGIRGS